MLRDKCDRGYSVCPASKCKAWPQRLMYGFRNNDGDRQGRLSKKRLRSFSYTASLYVIVQLGLREEKWAAFWVSCFNSNKIDKDLIETLVWIGYLFIFCFKSGVKAFWLIFYNIIINLIYPLFVSFLIATIRLVWLVQLMWRGLIRCAGLTRCTPISRIIRRARIKGR